MVASSDKRTCRELKDVSNERTSAIAGSVGKNVSSSAIYNSETSL